MFDWWIVIMSGIIWYISYAIIFNMKDTKEFMDTILYSQFPNKGYEFSWKLVWLLIIYRISQISFISLLGWNIIIKLAETIKYL